MWQCCICPERQFTSVRSYAMHVIDWHDDWLAERRVPPMPQQLAQQWLDELFWRALEADD